MKWFPSNIKNTVFQEFEGPALGMSCVEFMEANSYLPISLQENKKGIKNKKERVSSS